MINLFYKKLRNPKLKPTHFDQTFSKCVGFFYLYNQYLQQYFDQTSIQTNTNYLKVIVLSKIEKFITSGPKNKESLRYF
ncbi:hypothetical protein E0M25_27285 [Bacillus mycoides]|nr:hypothetical protein EXW30_29155 [Bacillus mycoides]QWG48267.1 hypothetical protein EXW31_29475 [Bacillus mycoides]TBX71378.1 hypothetical protein E0M25_27285 [Bacillus mycoides]